MDRTSPHHLRSPASLLPLTPLYDQTPPPFATAPSHHYIATWPLSPTENLGPPLIFPLPNICIYLVNTHSMLPPAMSPEIFVPREFRSKSAAFHLTNQSVLIPAMLPNCPLVSFKVGPASKCRSTVTFMETRVWVVGYSASFFAVVHGLVRGRRGKRRRESRHKAAGV